MEENKQPEELTEAAQEAAQIKEPEVDLTGQRNARVLPLVQRLFSKFSTFGFEFNDTCFLVFRGENNVISAYVRVVS